MPGDPTQSADSSTSSTSSTDVSGLRYGEALEELEELLDDLEDADIDVDRLAERVARGVELVRFCRDRLAVVTTDVDQVVAELLVTDGQETDGPSGDNDDSGREAADSDEAVDGGPTP